MKIRTRTLIILISILVFTSLTLGFPGDALHAKAASTVKISKTALQTTANLNLRSGASTKYKLIIQIPKGKLVTATEKKGSWYRVSYSYPSKGKTILKNGWVSGVYVKEYYQFKKISGTYFFSKKNINLYSSADTKKPSLSILPAYDGLYTKQKVVNSTGQIWYRISYNGKNLFVHSNNLTKQTPKSFKSKTYQANKDTYLFESYGKSYTKLIKIPKGSLVITDSSINTWFKTAYRGKKGYINSFDFSPYKGTTGNITEPSELEKEDPTELIETAIFRKTFVVKENLNVRSLANEVAAIQTTIPQWKIISPTHKVSNGWYKVAYGGKVGYASGSFLQEVRSGDPITTRYSYQFIDLRTKSPVTALQIDNYIENYVKANGKKSVLTGKGQAFIDAGSKFGVNALYLAAHAIHESGYGTSNISLGKKNLFGFGAYDSAPFIGAYRFSTVEQSIEYIAQEMKATYLNPSSWKYNGPYLGFSTKTLSNKRVDSSSEGMNFYYASDPFWGKAIAAHMERILAYNKAYYREAKPNLTVYAPPGKPSGGDVFPDNISAITKKEIKLTSTLRSENITTILKKNEKFTLLEKTNDFWVKIKVDDKIFWTNDIKFDRYKEYLEVQNLGRVLVESLNVRVKPSTSEKVIGSLKLNQYVQLQLDKEDKPIMDYTKKWFKVKLSADSIGWISSDFIVLELR